MKALRIGAWVVLGLLAAACSSAEGEDVGTEGEGATAGASFVQKPAYVDLRNASGTFRVYTTCLGPDPSKPQYIGRDGSVGPGYVATIWDAKGRVVSDDTAVLAHLGPNSGATGIGAFGFHLARVPQDGTPFTAGGENAFQVAGRFCNANRRPSGYGGYNGFGVRSSAVTDAPHVDAGGAVRFAMDVVLGDDHADLVKVRYAYVVGGHDVTMWIRVTNLCDRGKCGSDAAHGDAYVKEPKVIAGVNPSSPDELGYALMTTFAAGGSVAEGQLSNNHWRNACGESPGFPAVDARCEYGGMNPVEKTGQCDDPARAKVRFWSGKAACADDSACLVVAARAADAEGGATAPWSGSGKGLDGWAAANVAEHRDQAAPADTAAGGAKTSCGGNAAAPVNRRWEMAGYAKTAGCAYTAAVASFHGWEGGTGMFDCENLYYRLGPAGESYAMALSIGAGSVKAP